MKRLLICSRSHSPHGGADRIIVDLCRHLPKRGWQVTLGLTQGERFNDPGRYVEALGGDLPVVAIDGRRGTRSSRLRSIRQLVRSEQPDVVLSMRVFDAYEAVALEKASSGGPRLAVGIRSFEAPYLADLALYRDSVDLCVTSGELIAAAAIRHSGLPPERVVSIGGGVQSPLHPLAARQPHRPIRLLYAGRLDNEQKRILDLVPFLGELDRLGVAFELHVAGNGPAESALREQLADQIARGTVILHGWVPAETLYAEHYPRADCFVHFAAWEGMTIAPREAMAHGVVPVISRFPGLHLERQFVDGETALTFPVGDVVAAAACVQRLADEAGLMPRLSLAAASSQAGKYSFEGAMDAWAQAFDDCLGRPVRRGALPRIPSRTDGRLSRWGVPGAWQDRMRDWMGSRVKHSSPGSEWPTASGLLTEQARFQLEQLAAGLELHAP